MNISSTNKPSRVFPISKLFPNMVTLTALCMGLSSMRFALLERWETAVICIVIAALIDGIDGRLARLLKATSSFGAQLDSLADFVNFGVAPVFMMYLWKLNQIPTRGLGWAIVLCFSVCCAIRLARFNTHLEEEDTPLWAERFFIGIPSPAAAILALSPMMLAFKFGYEPYPEIVGGYIAIIGILMASRIPTFSFKKFHIQREYASLTLVIAGLLITACLIEPWTAIPILCLIYVLLIPFSWWRYRRYQQYSIAMKDELLFTEEEELSS